MPPRSVVDASTGSATDTTASRDYEESAAGSCISSSGKKRRKRLTGDATNVGDIILEAEEENMQRIRKHLEGNMDL